MNQFTCEDAILGMMNASGPQEKPDLRRECRTQAVPYDHFEKAIAKLLAEGKVVFRDAAFYDFPDEYYFPVGTYYA